MKEVILDMSVMVVRTVRMAHHNLAPRIYDVISRRGYSHIKTVRA